MRSNEVIITETDHAINALEHEQSIAFDLETSGLNPWKDRTLVTAMYGPVSKSTVVLHNPTEEPWDPRLMTFLSSRTPDGEQREYITHNGTTFDIPFIANAGMDVRAVKWWDTLISEQVSITGERQQQSVSLGSTFERRLGRSLKLKIDHAGWLNRWLTQDQIDYVTADIRYLHAVRDAQLLDCQDSRGKAMELEMRLLPCIVNMELHGIPIDLFQLQTYLEGQTDKANDAMVYLHDMLGDINYGSPVQIKKAFAARGHFIADTKAETMQDYSIMYGGEELGDLAASLLIYRHANQRQKMYDDEWISKWVTYDPGYDASFIHPRIKQASTDTGRFSCADPAMQQIPKDMRGVFGHVDGYSIVSVDYQAIEVRVAASLAKDQTMIEALYKQDIHSYVASLLFSKSEDAITPEERQVAKAATFTLLFGGGPKPLIKAAKENKVPLRLSEAKQIVESFFNIFEGLRKMRYSAYQMADQGGSRTLTLPTGLQRTLVGNKNLTAQRILNTLVQGTAAAFMKKAILNCALTPFHGKMVGDYLIATLHDELIGLVPEALAEEFEKVLNHVMVESAYEVLKSRKVPITANGSFGPCWTK